MKTVSVFEIMAHSGVAFGTSGARGLVESMTDEVCFTYTCAFLQHLTNVGQFAPGTPVAIAGDLRPSSPRILAACAAAIRHKGGEMAFCGFVPSPAVAAYGFERAIPSLMVTGSHIPDDRNGIKFNRIDGEILKADELAIRAEDVELPDLFDSTGSLEAAPELGPVIDVESGYLARYLDFFGPAALEGLRLGIYEHSAVGRDVLARIAEELGAEVVRLGRSETFVPVDTEAVREEDRHLAREWASQFNLDAILSTDGDSDRPLLADETGTWMRGDVLGILCAQALEIKAVATPVSCNTALELSGSFRDIRRTRIGSPFVIEAMRMLAEGSTSACGYEANGGFLLGTPIAADDRHLAALPTRDAVLPMVAVLAHARRKGATLSLLQAELPARYTFSERLKDFSTAESQAMLERLLQGTPADVLERLSAMFSSLAGTACAFDTTDGLRMTFENGDIIHLRPSGNAPELRCYTEGADPEHAEELNKQSLHLVANWVAAKPEERQWSALAC